VNSLRINIIKNNYSGYTPSNYKIGKWAKMSFANTKKSSVTIKFAKKSEIVNLNSIYFNKKMPCNVLSFPIRSEIIKGEYFLGDIVICPLIVNKESKYFNIEKDMRWAHMVVHSMLHLQGYTHDSKRNRKIMEEKEITLMANLGYTNPYNAN
tara:strand:- start:1359 stop:1814 length:456 start_codon:yes stop_codon:yes gene_type:complete